MPNAQFSMPHAHPEPVVGVARPPGRRGPMPNAQCPMPNAQCPIPLFPISLQTLLQARANSLKGNPGKKEVEHKYG
ncbi:MAG: hypothetical protein F6J93_33190 [Oscillatoria sp. SIO1A7]|nr:hypothetical protein [Oscillatoria sp. SIO1A7]